MPTLLHWPALLLPIHIVLLELIIDPACSIVFEAEPEARDLMQRPPRPHSHSPFAWRQWWIALLQGGGVAAVLLGGHAWMVVQGWVAPQARAVAFCTLVCAVFLLILANRQPRRFTGWHWRSSNPWLERLALGMLVLLGLVFLVPGLSDLMAMAPPPASLWPVVPSLLLLCALWLLLLHRLSGRVGN